MTVAEVQFEREVAELPAPPRDDGSGVASGNPILRNMTLARRATIVIGALAVAGFSHLAGLGLGGALCVFVGVLPVLFVMSVLVGVSAAVNTAAKVAREGAPADPMTLVRRQQRVRLRALPEALELELQDGAKSEIERWAWADVKLLRTADAIELTKAPRAMIVPLATSGLDAFVAVVERYTAAEKT